MKKVFALILIVACIAIAIVGWNGLMKTYTAQSSDGEAKDISTSDGRNYYWNRLDELEHGSSQKSNPWIIPVGTLAIGVIGVCYGAYSLAKSIKPRMPGSKPTGG
ncbi:MAG: hypothetical protein WC938_01040 [Candidatus Paceibacterota bacterium]|jgi:hypothetical protein